MDGSQERPGNRAVRVRVAAARDHVAEPLLEARRLGRHLQPDPGREQREPHVGPVDPTGPTRLHDEVLELLPPSRSTTDATAFSTAGPGSVPRTTAAVASVIARHAVRHRSSACVIDDSSGASSWSTSGRVARKAPSGAQYITDPLPAETSGPRSATYRAAASGSPSRMRRNTHS